MENTYVPDLGEIAVYLGLDVGKGEHHAVARDAGCTVAYLPALTMRRIADLYPGEAKTDASDARVIADAARTSNRIRGLLTSVHPRLERVIGPRISHPAVLSLLIELRVPAGIRTARLEQVTELLRRQAPRMAERLAGEIFTALDEQTVVMPGTDAASVILPGLATTLKATLDQRKHLEAEIERLLEAHPLSPVLTSMPGIGIRTGARILAEIGDATTFPSSAHLAAYAGLAPVTSGRSKRANGTTKRCCASPGAAATCSTP